MAEYPDADEPDFERLVGHLLRPLVSQDNHIGNFLVVDFEQISPVLGEADVPFITIRKRGGTRDVDDFTLFANIEVSCWGKSREVAQGTARSAAKLLLACDGGSEIDGVLIDTVEDAAGSEEVIEVDDRQDTQLFTIGARPLYQ